MIHRDPNVDSTQVHHEKSLTERKTFIIDLQPEEFSFVSSEREVERENLSPDANAPKSRSPPASKLKKSPKRVQELLDHSRNDVEASRRASALRSEERQRLAQESRMDYLQEIKKKSFLEVSRFLQAKKKREQAHQIVSSASRSKQECGIRRAEEARLRTQRKVKQNHSRIDEVRFTNETKTMEKQILLNKKMNEVEQHLEQKREERQKHAQVKNDAIRVAAERRLNLSQEREIKQLQRAHEREEKEKRIEENKKNELKSKLQKSEEWERKIQQHQQESEAETHALVERTQEKFKRSELLLKKRREEIQRKIQMQENKLKEAKERRDREVEFNHSYKDIMESYDTEDDELLSQKLLSTFESSQKQCKYFSETYQKSCPASQKELLKSKLRGPLGRLSCHSTAGEAVQCRPLLSEICGVSVTPMDHEYLRYSNSFEIIVRIILLARKTRHVAIVKQAVDTLVFYFSVKKEGLQHITYFVRSGLASQIIVAAHEEANTMRKNSLTTILASLLNCIATCMDILLGESEGNGKVTGTRDLLMSESEKLSLDRIYFVVLKMCLAPKDLELTYVALRIIHVTLLLNSRKRGDSKGLWHYCLAVSLFALLQNIVAAGAGNPVAARGIEIENNFTSSQLVLLFYALRLLNMLARWRLSDFQEMFHDYSTSLSGSPSTSFMITNSTDSYLPDISMHISRMELFHFANKFFEYIHKHSNHLENIVEDEDSSVKARDGSSFSDAEKFGITLAGMPQLAQSKDGELHRSILYGPGGKQYHLRAALHECILLLGYLSLDDPPLQEMFSWGKGTSLLENLLVTLPAHYFTNARHILFPTLLCIIDNSGRNTAIVQNVMELQLLQMFLEDEVQHLSKKARLYAENRAKITKDFRNATEGCLADERSEETSCESRNEVVKKGKKGKVMAMEIQDKLNRVPSNDFISSGDEKEKLIKSFRASVSDANSFFKIDKRIPVAFWPLLLNQIQECTSEKVL